MKNIRLIVFVTLASVVAGAVLLAQKRPARRAKPVATQKSAPAKQVRRETDPNRAPQALVDQALFAEQLFFNEKVAIPRPYLEALTAIDSLVGRFPQDPGLRLHGARLNEKLGRFGESAKQMAEYARLKHDNEDALSRLAVFYHHRANYAAEAQTLQRLARVSNAGVRRTLYGRVISLINNHQLREIDENRVYEEMIASDPDSFEAVKGYAQALIASKQYAKALQVLDRYQPQFERELRFFFQERARIFEARNDRAGAVDSYSQRFDPVWPRGIAADFYELLRRYGKYSSYRRELQAEVRKGAAGFEEVSRLFNVYAYESNIPYAARTLEQYEERKARTAAGQAALTPKELQQIAVMYSAIGYYDQASRFLYTLYLNGALGTQSKEREDVLARLFQVLIDAGNVPTRVGAGDLKFYRDVAAVDQNPGLLNGVLSLILSNTSNTRPAEEFRQEEAKAAGYFNRSFAFKIFTSYKQDYPLSPRLPRMYLGMIDAFAGFGEHRIASELGMEFQAKFLHAPEYAEVSLKVADSLVALKRRDAERAVLAGLLDHIAVGMPARMPLLPASAIRWQYNPSGSEDEWIQAEDSEERVSYQVFDPAERNGYSPGYSPYIPPEYSYAGREIAPARSVTYGQVLERIVASYAAGRKREDILRFFWGEIRKHPKEEGLYERFLKWLGQANLIEEQLKAYTAAINEYDNPTWYDRLARWYLRQKRTRAFLTYSKELIDVFDDSEAHIYVQHFPAIASSLSGDYDQSLAFELLRMAHDRFPRNTEFVKGLLVYYANTKQWGAWQRLLTQYYFAGRQFREPLLAQFVNIGQLRARLDEARSHANDLSSQEFVADVSLWLSHYEDALAAYRELAALYPGEPAYVRRLADLTRSLGSRDPLLRAQSAAAWSGLASIYPAVHSYRIHAGETLAEAGDFPGARGEWEKLLEHERGNPEAYREVASIYWDYYQWDDAIRVIQELRKTSGQDHVLAYEMGALYEGKGEWSKAIEEYVATLGDASAEETKAIARLAQLAPRRNYREVIAGAFEARRASEKERGPLVLAFARYLSDAKRPEESYELLRKEVTESVDISFLESARDVFHANGLAESEQSALVRLAGAARDVREQMQYRLQLAAFFEASGDTAQATRIYDQLTGDFPTNLGIIEEASAYYKRTGLFDQAIGLYQSALGKARGTYQRDFTLALASLQVDSKKLSDAEITLRALYEKDPLDTESFAKLAQALGEQGKDEALLDLYRSGLDRIKKAAFGREAKTDRIAQLRMGMITTLARLNKPSEAVDQYIEIVNRQAEDTDVLRRAVEFAKRNGQLERMLKYYSDLSARSFKDYRWNLVLARMAEDRGDYSEASVQYQKAAINEPQRLDFHSSLADSLFRAGKPDDAIAALRKAAALDSGNVSWLTKIASIQVRQGKRAEAVSTLRAALASRKKIFAKTIFDSAASLRSWELSKEALEFYNEGFKRYFESPYEQTLSSEVVNGYIDASLKSSSVLKTAQALDSMLATLRSESEKETNYEKDKIQSAVNTVSEAIEKVFAKQVAAFGAEQDLRSLADYYKQQIAQIAGYSEDSQTRLRRYATLAENALLPDVGEAVLIRLAGAAFERYSSSARQRPNASQSSAEVTALPLPSGSGRGQPLPPAAYGSNQASVDAQHYYDEMRNLLSFYEGRAAFEKSIQFLKASYQRDPVKDKFDYFGELAWRYQLLGRTDEELAALRQFYASQAGSLTLNEHPSVTRYLELLSMRSSKETNLAGYKSAADELRDVAARYNPYQLQVINFFINHSINQQEESLALEAIAHSGMPPGWIASRSAQVALFFRDRSARAEGFFKIALDVRTIGAFIASPAGPPGELSQHDWYWTAGSYGAWLGLTDTRAAEAKRYLPGTIERRPRDPEAQLFLAGSYLKMNQTRSAAEHAALASELAPGNARVLAMKGAVLYSSGKTSDAIASWQSIASRKEATAADVQLYFEMMRQRHLVKQALPAVERYLLQAIPRAASFELIKPFLREVAYSAYAEKPERERKVAQALGPEAVNISAADQETFQAIYTMLRSLTEKLPNDLLLPEMALNERLIPESGRGDFYRLVIAREERKVLALESSGNDANSYSEWNGSEYVQPLKSLALWRAEYVDYLIEQKAFSQARAELARVRAAETARRRDNYFVTQAIASDTPGDAASDWTVLAEGKLALREGKADEAARMLRRYAGIGISSSEAGIAPAPNKERAVAVSRLLEREGHAGKAIELMRDVYSQLLAAGQRENANFAGLAETEFKRGEKQSALDALRRMVNEKLGDAGALKLAAALASRYSALDVALEYRQRARDVNREDSENWLELCRVLAALDQRAEAAEEIRKLVSDPSSPNTAKAAALFVIPEIVKGDVALAGKLIASYRSGGTSLDTYSKLILAQLLDISGHASEAESLLRAEAGSLYGTFTNMLLGVFELSRGDRLVAASAFERALYGDPAAVITQTTAFAAGLPRDLLIKLYAAGGRDAAALELAKRSPFYELTGESETDDEGGVIYSDYREDSILSSRPDGWFAEFYLYPLYSSPPSSLFKIPPGHGPLKAADSALQGTDVPAARFRTLAELSLDASLEGRRNTLRLLSQVAARRGELRDAIDYERARRPLLVSAEAAAESKRHLLNLLGQQQEEEKKLLARVKIDKAFTGEPASPSAIGQE